MRSPKNSAAGKRPAAPHTSTAAWPWPQALFVLWLLGCAVYFGYFFSTGHRWQLWSLLLRPDDVLAEWVAFDSRQLGIFDRGPIFACVVAILLAALGSGWQVLRLAISTEVRSKLTSAEQGLFAVAVGLSLLSIATLLLGLLGGLQQTWLVRLAIGVLAVFGIIPLTKVNWQAEVATLRQQRPSVLWLGALYFLVAAALMWAAALPPWDFDVREYHLQVPKEWYQTGRIEFLPHNVYASMPLGAEMHPLLAMSLFGGSDGWWWGALAGKVVMAAYVPLTAGLIACAGWRWLSPLAGAAGGLLYVGIPGLSFTAVHGLNEPAVAAFGLFAFYCVLLAKETPPLTILAGWFAGSALACKYPAVLLVVIPLGIWTAWQQTDRRQILIFALAVFAAGGLWLTKNGAQTGNPVYPLLGSLFGGATRTPDKDAQFRSAHQTPPHSLAQLRSAVTGIACTHVGQSPLIIPLILLSLVSLRDATAARHLLIPTAVGLVWIFGCWWFFTHRIERFWYPAFPMLTLLAISGLAKTCDRWQHYALGSVLGLGILYHGLFLISPLAGDTRWFTRLDSLRVGNSLHPNDVPRLATTFRYLNAHATVDDAVLFIGEAAVFDSNPRAFYNTCFDDSLAADWFVDRTPAEQQAELTRRGINWVYVNSRELARYRSPGNYGYDPRFREEFINELVAAGILHEVSEANESDGTIRLFRVKAEK